jgi:hypothetical protein
MAVLPGCGSRAHVCQSGYFLRAAPEKPQFAIDRYIGEAKRHIRVLDQHLAKYSWAAGNAMPSSISTIPIGLTRPSRSGCSGA